MNNILMQYQAHESVFVDLPSNGLFYADGIIDNPSEAIGVKKMSAKDEMIMNNPDALMNGRAVSSVISNCVPSVHKPQELCVADMEALLLGIKQASGQKTYEINTECPSCKATGVFERDIEAILYNVKQHTEAKSIPLDNGLVAYLRPNSWKSHSTIQQLAFKQQRLAVVAKSEEIADADKLRIFKELFDDMIELNFAIVCDCIHYIETPEEQRVYDANNIREFIETVDKVTLKKFSDEVQEINEIGVERTMDVQCSKCDHQWTLNNLRFDPSYFFGQNSSLAQSKK